MKFDYDTENSGVEAVVAFIMGDELYVKGVSDSNIVFNDLGVYKGQSPFEHLLKTNLDVVSKKFYKGDKITITF